MTEQESKLTLKQKEERNIWDHIDVVFSVLQKVKNREWSWSRNQKCKYLNLRVDMRDGGCIIMDREGNRISPEDLEYQYRFKGEE